MVKQKHCGQLSKYTNVMKGWQYRWFVLDPVTGCLDYYLNDCDIGTAPRGSIHLQGAIICPSEEDSYTFSVNSTSGESYKLRATDARSRQEWINRLRSVAEFYRSNFIKYLSSNDEHGIKVHSGIFVHGNHIHSPGTCETFTSAKNHFHEAEQKCSKVIRCIEGLPNQGSFTSNNAELLKLKACSRTTITCLNECINILQCTFAADCGFRSAFPNKLNESTSIKTVPPAPKKLSISK